MPKSSTLSLAMRGKGAKDGASTPMSPKSPRSPGDLNGAEFASPPNAPFHHPPESPASPKLRKDSKSIFSNFSATRSSSRITNQDASIRHIPAQQPSPVYSNGRGGTSTPDLSRPVQTPNSDGKQQQRDTCMINGLQSLVDNRSERLQLDRRTGSDMSNDHPDPTDTSKRNTIKPKKQGMLARSRSTKDHESSGTGTRAKLNKAPPPQLSPELAGNWTTNGDGVGVPLKTAPLEKGQSWRSLVGHNKMRTHSADRHDHPRDDDQSLRSDPVEQGSLASNSYNESKGAALMSSLGSGARKVGGKMDSARKGIFGKLGRSSSNHETPTLTTNEPYVCKLIHKPLIEQTRLTRISSRLEQSRDKTEFWMPALPWRCIDYLNMRGCEEEGLYRVPGSAQQVRYYERKFDTDKDIDLISDPNLNDPNVIGSLFKGWLRQLPDEIFPKEIQARIQRECQGVKTTPQLLKDELSKLPPFNYYLLFAITCHISLLHSCSEFNKMNYNNLCICFQPAIKIDAFCFQFLILDWRNCWQGCWTEKDYLGDEIEFLNSLELARQQETTARTGQPYSASKPKHSHSSPQVPHAKKASSLRNESFDKSKSATRGLSSDRNGRATPPNPALVVSEPSSLPTSHSRHLDRDTSTERTISSSDSREAFNARATPKRPPPPMSTGVPVDADDAATPTQASQKTLHSRDPSDTQFRLDLSNPPSSPFNIKF